MVDSPGQFIPVPWRAWDEVIPRLWMGGSLRGREPEPERFDTVVTLSEQAHKYVPIEPSPDVDVSIPMEDAGLPDALMLAWAVGVVVLDYKLGGTILVRCDAGLNRSGLVVAEALLLLGHTSPQAVARVRRARGPDALCNPAFLAHVMRREQYE